MLTVKFFSSSAGLEGLQHAINEWILVNDMTKRIRDTQFCAFVIGTSVFYNMAVWYYMSEGSDNDKSSGS